MGASVTPAEPVRRLADFTSREVEEQFSSEILALRLG